MTRLTLGSALLLVVTGCSTDSAWTAGPDHAFVVESTSADLHFHPLQLDAGDRVTAEVGGVRLESLATGSSHQVSLRAAGRTVREVNGLLDGQTHLTSDGTADGGTTSVGPTSVHKRLVCRSNSCSEIIEYDYDLHDPSGEGTAVWRTPDGRSATIDRLQYVLDAEPVRSEVAIRLRTPTPAMLVRRSPGIQ